MYSRSMIRGIFSWLSGFYGSKLSPCVSARYRFPDLQQTTGCEMERSCKILRCRMPVEVAWGSFLRRCASTRSTEKAARPASSSPEVTVLNEKQLPLVLQDLKKQFPFSIPVYNLMKNKSKHVRGWPGMEFVVDSYPDYSVCIARTSLSKDKNPVMYNGPVAMVYSRDDAKLKELLRRKDVLDWKNKISFMGIRKKNDEPTIMERCDELNGVAGQTPGAGLCLESYHYILFDDLNEAAYEYDKLPEGLILGELKSRHATELAKHEKYGVGPDFKNNEKFFQYLLSNGFPSVALLDKDDYPVAHMIQRPENSLGAGYVHPDYRSQGLYKVVVIELIKKIRDNDEKHCWANVAVDNEHSTNTLTKLGGHVYEGELFTTFEYHPKHLIPDEMSK